MPVEFGHQHYDAVVVGGGFFGCSLAVSLRQRLEKVLLIEKEPELLTRASYANQARVHGGYHYPRSIVTGLRSQANYKIFLSRFASCVDATFKKYYAISRRFSNVNAQQFRTFCTRISAPLSKAPPEVRRHFNPDMIEEVFEVEECAFDAVKLRAVMDDLLRHSGVECCTGRTVHSVERSSSNNLAVRFTTEQQASITSGEVYLCVYSSLNSILAQSGLPLIPLRHELAEMALVEPPPPFSDAGITVMCGPFFSLMPFPARKLHSFSHVRYTPHFTWNDDDAERIISLEPKTLSRESRFVHMRKDAERFIPALRECTYVESLWETKTLLPRNEQDDARPILFKRHQGLPNLSCIIGGKIDNIFDVDKELSQQHQSTYEHRL